jgi:hypothetical protein
VPDDHESARAPVVRAADADRAAAVSRLEVALAEGRIDHEEFGQRASAAYAAVTTADLDALLADLPRNVPAEVVGRRTAEELSSVFGDIHLAGAVPPERASSVFGDVRIDLRAVRTGADRIELFLSSTFGHVDVILAEGMDGELHGRTVFGHRKVELAPGPRPVGTPYVVVHARTVFGDLRLRSLAPGESPSRWKAMLDRLAHTRRPLPPPPPPPSPLPPPPHG